MFTSIAILIVGSFVGYAAMVAVAFFTDGGRAGKVMATATAVPERRMRR